MGRLLDLTILLIAILTFLTLQAVAGPMLDGVRDATLEQDIGDKYNAEENFADTYEVVTVWAPLTGLFGITILVIYREYRRQRITAVRGVR